MTPQEFHDAFRPTADQVGVGTGIDPIALLAQWANETSWGTGWAGAPYNLGNIRNGPGGSIISYGSLGEFVQACVATYHNGYYDSVLAATNAIDQLAAICASPWSAGHYGGSLSAFYTPLEPFELTDEQNNCLHAIQTIALRVEADLGAINQVTLGRMEGEIKTIPTSEPIEPPDLTAKVDALTAAVARIEAFLSGTQKLPAA